MEFIPAKSTIDHWLNTNDHYLAHVAFFFQSHPEEGRARIK